MIHSPLPNAFRTFSRLTVLLIILCSSRLRAADVGHLFQKFDMAMALGAECDAPAEAFYLAEQIRDAGRSANDVQLESRGLIRMALASSQQSEEPSGAWKQWRAAAAAMSCEACGSQLAQLEVLMIGSYLDGIFSDDAEVAIEGLQHALSLATETNEPRTLGRGFFYLGRVLAKDGQYLRSGEFLNHGLFLSRKANDTIQEYVTLRQLMKDRFAAGVITEHEAERFRQLAEELGQPCIPAAVPLPGRIPAARELHARLMRSTVEQETDRRALSELVQVSSFLSVHSAKLDAEDDARAYLQDAQYAAILLRDSETIGRLMWNRACTLARLHDTDEAMFAVDNQLRELGQRQAHDELFARCHQLASIFEASGEHAAATRCLKLAISTAKSELASPPRVGDGSKDTPANAERLDAALKFASASLLQGAVLPGAASAPSVDTPSAAAARRRPEAAVAFTLCLVFSVAFLVDRQHRRERRRLKSRLASRSSLITTLRHEAERSRSEAACAVQSKNDFLALLNHALREPLTSIVGNCELLANDRTRDTGIARSTVRSSVRRVIQVIDSAMDIKGAESVPFPSLVNPFSPHKMLESVRRTVLPLVREGVSLNVDVDASVPDTVQADETRLRQALVNLGQFAARHSKHGSIRYLCTVRKPDSRNDRNLLVISLEATGLAHATTVQDDTCDSTAASQWRPGQGACLETSSTLIQQMQGAVAVAPNQENVTSIRVEVPFATIDTAKTRPHNRVAVGDHQTDYRVLVVDDDDANLRVVAGMLEVIGCTGMLAPTWERAEEHLLKGVDIVLMDLHLHCADGFELFNRIKQLPLEVMPAVIAMTGDLSGAAKLKVQQDGFEGFLAKPFSLAKLRDEINAAVESEPAIPIR